MSARKSHLPEEERKRKFGHRKNFGKDMGGIKDIDSLRNHCRIEDDGCWTYAGNVNPARKGRSPSVYVRPLHKAISIGSAVCYIKFGYTTPKGRQFVAKCGNPLCANPDHRKLMKTGGHMTVKSELGQVDPSFARNLRPAPQKLTDAQVVEIYNTRDTATVQEQMEKYGISESYCCALRAGKKRAAALMLSVRGPAGMFSQLLAAA